MTDWALTEEETKALLSALQHHTNEGFETEDGSKWDYLHFAVPRNFTSIAQETIEGYKLLTESDKTFPAIEALFLEAFNALPQEIRERITQKKE